MIAWRAMLEAVSCVLYLFSLTMLFALRWARRTYPMNDAALVYFVLTSETGGVDSGTFKSILRNVLVPAVAVDIVSFLIIAAVNTVAKELLPYPMLSIKWNILLLLYTASIMAIKLRAWRYVSIFLRVHKRPVSSRFYDAFFVEPRDANITIPEKRRNLIIIFMESMEATFADITEGGLVPHLEDLAREGLSFGGDEEHPLGGGLNLDGTSWTVAGIISKLSGLPYFNPFAGHGKERAALRNATSLGDILRGAGYNCIFSMGSEKRFEGRDAFLEMHGFEIHDIDWYKEKGMIDKGYKVFWGFEDAKLFALAKKEIEEAAAGGGPFCYAMLTVDTHFPDGYRCPLCPTNGEGKKGHRQIENVVHCADNQVNDFVLWCKEKEWYKDTAIVIMGDHNYLGAPCNDFVRDSVKSKTERKWLDVVLNGGREAMGGTARKFSSYDMFPTMLEMAGFYIENGALAFGRSLFHEGETLTEKMGETAVNDALMRRTVQYEALKK